MRKETNLQWHKKASDAVLGSPTFHLPNQKKMGAMGRGEVEEKLTCRRLKKVSVKKTEK